jgi:caffeoyl-CoA O-methyltransferase
MGIPLMDARIAAYLDQLVPPRDPVMAEMEADAERTGFPIIGPASGQLCYLLTRLTGARQVCELGSGFGYSTAWFARAVKENGGGTVHHVVWDDALSARARAYLRRMRLDDQVAFHVGEAVGRLRELPGPFDLIFNDIDKDGYPEALRVIETRLRPGGLLIADNLLWSGRVLDEADRSDKTEGIRSFTARITASPDWTGSIVPIRDGVMVARWSPAGPVDGGGERTVR